MAPVAYLFERFPSFGQTFCYREVAELDRHGMVAAIFSIRRPTDEPVQDWDDRLVRRVHYLPEEKTLIDKVDRDARREKLPATVGRALAAWGRQADFLRLYQAAYIGAELQAAGIGRVHAHFAGMAARTAYWIKEFFGIAYSFTAHANDIFAPRDFAVGLDKLMAGASAIVGVSDFGASFLKEQFPEHAARVHRIYNGLDLSKFREATFENQVPLIVSVGRLIEKKGFGDLIAACGLLKKRGLNFRCEIVGEGPLEAALTSRIEGEGLASQVKLGGPQTQGEIATLLAAATVFALPCRKEEDGGMDNLPTVIMEAMAAGLPVVSTSMAGIPEMVETGASGELVPAGDTAALAEAVATFLTDRVRARRFGQHGRELARQRFSLEASAHSLLALFSGT